MRVGQPTSVSADVALRAVALRLDKSVEPLEFEQIEGRIDAERIGDRTSVAVRRFGFRTGDGLSWPKGDLRVAWRENESGAVTSGEFDADRLDIGVMAEIGTRVPIGAAVRDAARRRPARAARSASCARAGTVRSTRPRTTASRACSAACR